MTTDLRELMTERTEHLDPPVLDPFAILARGRRRVRRRRYAGVAGAAVLAVGAALVAPGVLGNGGTDGLVAEVPADRTDPVAWVRGSMLHTSPDGPAVDLGAVGREPVSLVQGDSGSVFSEADGSVHAVLEGEVLEVGRMADPAAGLFESDGDVVAWVDADEGARAYAVMDLAQGQGVTRLPVRRGQGTPLQGEPTEAVAAVDGTTVYLQDRNGPHVWRPFDAEDEIEALPVADGTRAVLEDVKNGVFHYHRTGGTPAAKEEAYVVGPDLTSGTALDSWEGTLSPDGRYLMSETEDENRLFDTTTGQRLPFDPGDHEFLVGYRWLDGDTYAALALDDVDAEVVDLLRCEVVAGTCETVVPSQDLTSGSTLVLPIGEAW